MSPALQTFQYHGTAVLCDLANDNLGACRKWEISRMCDVVALDYLSMPMQESLYSLQVHCLLRADWTLCIANKRDHGNHTKYLHLKVRSFHHNLLPECVAPARGYLVCHDLSVGPRPWTQEVQD
jgi:hypothetical protein